MLVPMSEPMSQPMSSQPRASRPEQNSARVTVLVYVPDASEQMLARLRAEGFMSADDRAELVMNRATSSRVLIGSMPAESAQRVNDDDVAFPGVQVTVEGTVHMVPRPVAPARDAGVPGRRGTTPAERRGDAPASGR